MATPGRTPVGWIEEMLACPRDGSALAAGEEELACSSGHAYPLVDGVAVLVVDELDPTQPGYWATREQIEAVRSAPREPEVPGGVDPYVGRVLEATHGRLYGRTAGLVSRYPIPHFPIIGEGLLVDIGCNWGRWTIAAASSGFDAVGIDPSFEAISAAQRIAAKLDTPVRYAVADARALPFHDGSVEVVFSYSVLQHFSEEDARIALDEIGRVLKPGGQALVQMANAHGVWNAYRRTRRHLRGRRQATGFDVRYWTPDELLHACERAIGPAQLHVDGFFTLNPRASDLDLLPLRYQAIVRVSEGLRKVAGLVPPLRAIADSLFVQAVRR